MDIKKKSILLVAISIFLLVNVSLINAETFIFDNPTIPSLRQETSTSSNSDATWVTNWTAYNTTWSLGASGSDATWISNWTAYNTSWSLNTEPTWITNWTAYNTTWSSTTNSSYLLNTGDNATGDYIFNGNFRTENGSIYINGTDKGLSIFDRAGQGSFFEIGRGTTEALKITSKDNDVNFVYTQDFDEDSEHDFGFDMQGGQNMSLANYFFKINSILEMSLNQDGVFFEPDLIRFDNNFLMGFKTDVLDEPYEGFGLYSNVTVSDRREGVIGMLNNDVMKVFIRMIENNTQTGESGEYISFGVNQIERMRIDENGYLGINTSTPQNTLNVLGDANITGLIYGNGSQLTNIPTGDLSSYRTLINHTFPYVIVQNNGTDNVFIGDTTTGNGGVASNVVVIGSGAGASMLLTADNNVFLGSGAGAGVTSGNNNVLIGTNTGSGLTTSASNVLIGINAGSNLSTSIGRNTFIGVNAGQYMSGNSNTAVGYLSGSAQSNTGNNGIYFGYQAGASNTIGSNNLYFGYNAGEGTTTGGSNMFIGSSAGVKNIDGGSNTYVGNFVATQSTTGDRNLVMGANAGKNIMGNDNFIMGYNTGDASNIASPNFLVGNYAGTQLVGKNNLFLGFSAGRYQTDINNTFIVDNFARGSKANDLARALIVGTFNGNPLLQTFRINAGNITGLGNITSENVFIKQYLFAHTNETIPLLNANNWTNITFNQEVTSIKFGISHTFDDNTNQTFTINENGIYDLEYDFDLIDTSPSATDIDVAGRVIFANGTEIIGSSFETDITKQQIETEISHNTLVRLSAGDKIIFQFNADDSDVVISTHSTFGDHPDSATIIITKIANLPT